MLGFKKVTINVSNRAFVSQNASFQVDFPNDAIIWHRRHTAGAMPLVLHKNAAFAQEREES